MPDLRDLCLLYTLPVQGRGWSAIAAVALLALAGAAIAGNATALEKAPVAADTDRVSVTTVVAGIVSYTRWPGQTMSVRLCTLGQGLGVDELQAAADLGSAQRSVPVRAAKGVIDAFPECDVIYVGALAGSATRDVLQRAVGRPVLMIGEGAAFCSDGGMFCLDPGAAAVRFTVNLDAVARSGLRVNPSVLRIARNTPGGGR